MPGSIYTLHCACGPELEISTGAGCSDGGASWRYEQVVCAACRSLRSIAVEDDPAHSPPSRPCPACGEPMARWAGFAGIEHTTDGRLVERVAGPCPRCGDPFEAYETGMWD